MVEGEIVDLLRRGVLAIERLADHFAPIEAERQKRPATLGKAIYNREEREAEARRKACGGQE